MLGLPLRETGRNVAVTKSYTIGTFREVIRQDGNSS